MQDLCEKWNLLTDTDNVVRLPMLVKGEIVAPPKISKAQIERAFHDKPESATYARLDDAQILREPVIDRASMKPTGDYQYQVLSPVDPLRLIERQPENLAKTLYDLPFSEVTDYLGSMIDAMEEDAAMVERVREISRRTATHPDLFHDMAFDAFPLVLSPDVAKVMVDSELSFAGEPGSRFLDGWVDIAADTFPGLTAALTLDAFESELPEGLGATRPQLRAMPTRQLHITAGNAPSIPIFSLLRAIITKGAAVVKSPYGALVPGALVALAAAKAAPEHPITKNLSVVYWPGGHKDVEDVFFAPGVFDRIVVWGAPDAVSSVRSRAQFTRTICFNPRYGVSLIGREAFGSDLRQIAIRAVSDALIWNQKACTASFVQYVEGTKEQAEEYARALRAVLERWEDYAPNYVPSNVRGALKRMKRGKYMNACWQTNTTETGDFLAGVMVSSEQFDMLDHPMSRMIVLRPVSQLEKTLPFMHHGVASVGVYPEERRLALRDAILSRGVTNVLPLGEVERSHGGMSHDGMMVLGELVDWKNG